MAAGDARMADGSPAAEVLARDAADVYNTALKAALNAALGAAVESSLKAMDVHADALRAAETSDSADVLGAAFKAARRAIDGAYADALKAAEMAVVGRF